MSEPRTVELITVPVFWRAAACHRRRFPAIQEEETSIGGRHRLPRQPGQHTLTAVNSAAGQICPDRFEGRSCRLPPLPCRRELVKEDPPISIESGTVKRGVVQETTATVNGGSGEQRW